MNKRVAEVLLGLKEALDENGPEVEGLGGIVAVTHAVNEGAEIGNDLQDLIDRSKDDRPCWQALQCLLRVSRDPDNLPAPYRAEIQAAVDDPGFQEWVLDVADGTRSEPPPGKPGRPASTWRNLLVVDTIFKLQGLGLGVMEACRLVGGAIHHNDVYRDIWLRRNRDDDVCFGEVGTIS